MRVCLRALHFVPSVEKYIFERIGWNGNLRRCEDVRELMAARDLHVIDVRDTDPNGKPPDAFGRVFLTEGKSLALYAFDLNPAQVTTRSFQVWAVADSGKNSSRSLGFLHADAKAPGRCVLKVDNPELVKQISAVFVTSEPATGVKEPSTQKMLYAYLARPITPSESYATHLRRNCQFTQLHSAYPADKLPVPAH